MLENSSKHAIVYTGDTGPTEQIWKRMRGHHIKALIVDVSFPDELMELALTSGHLTPSLLAREIEKMPLIPERIYLTHLKPFWREEIAKQIDGLGAITHLEILRDGMVISI
jgi:ribonuclease BN (tRNA processing enzyme)